jgi:RNA polymerase sigma-70 factor (ECF subfamily)
MSALWDDAPDERLLGSMRGEPAAFGALYRRHEDQVLSFFLARTGHAEVAADLTAETFAAALASGRRLWPRRTRAAAWLFGIARKTLTSSRRRGRVEDRARRRLGMAPLVLTDDAIERITELDHTALARVDELPGDQHDAVMARVSDQLGSPDVATDLRCSEALVRDHVSRPLGTHETRLEEK